MFSARLRPARFAVLLFITLGAENATASDAAEIGADSCSGASATIVTGTK